MDIGTLTTEHFWGKLHPREQPTEWHPLADHCLDVACVGEAVMALPTWRQRLSRAGLPLATRAEREALSWLLGLHDLGKLSEGFQRARHGVRAESHTMPVWDIQVHAQDAVPLAHALVRRMAGNGEPWPLLLAAATHHGRPACFETRRFPWAAGERDPVRGLEDLCDALDQAFPLAQEGLRSLKAPSASSQAAFCGLAILADWLGSHRGWFPYRASWEEDRATLAREAAATALHEIGLDAETLRRDTMAPDFGRLFPGFSPRGVQRLTQTLPLPDAASVALIEASTGSGKTEAALHWFARLFQAGQVDGLYFALPTRAAAFQLRRRVLQAARSLWGEDAPPVVLAIPGQLQVDGTRGQALPERAVLWEDFPRQGRGWAAEHPKRFLAAPIAVGTIDQVLLGGLKSAHAHLRGVCLLRQLLVVDEVHSSDTYMGSILRHLLDRHQSVGGHALLLSATLGAPAREQLLYPEKRRARPTLSSSAEVPYPMVWVRSGEGLEGHPPDQTGGDKQVQLALLESVGPGQDPSQALLDALVPKVEAAARAGARVLILRNTVGDAQATLRRLEQLPEIEGPLLRVEGQATLHHGRFAAPDRSLLDEALEARLGPTRPDQPRAPVVVVATSTAEQSLDLDADVLFTDLCPVDVLLQRIGRLHRHPCSRRPEAYQRPHCSVLTHPGDCRALARVRAGEVGGVHGYGRVYEDLRMLEQTRRMLQPGPSWSLPADNRWLVEQGTHPEALKSLEEDEHAQKLAAAHRGAEAGRRVQAELGLLDWNEALECSGWKGRPPTRLGLDDRMVRFAEPARSPFGRTLHQLRVPGWMLRGLDEDDPEVQPVLSGGALHFELAGRRFRYDRLGLSLA